MEHVYEKARSSSDGSRYHDSSEEDLGFISAQPTDTKRRYGQSVAERLRTVSLRAVGEFFLGGIVVLLLVIIFVNDYRYNKAMRSGRSTIRRYGPSLPEKEVVFGNIAGFGPQIVYVDHEMLWNATHKRELHENWQQLYPRSRGYVKAYEDDEFEHFNPAFEIDNFMTDGDHYEGYILSVFHQLHCLSILMARLGTSYDEFANYTRPQLEHTTHCVEYLRQAILCNADTSLEGETGAWPASAAWGQKHTCKDYDALVRMADERGMWDLSGKRHPDIHKIKPNPDETKGKYGGD